MINTPQAPSGNKPLNHWLARLLAYVKALRPLESPDFTMEQTADGWRYRLKNQGSGAGTNNYLTWRVRVNGVLKDVEIDSKPPTDIA